MSSVRDFGYKVLNGFGRVIRKSKQETKKRVISPKATGEEKVLARQLGWDEKDIPTMNDKLLYEPIMFALHASPAAEEKKTDAKLESKKPATKPRIIKRVILGCQGEGQGTPQEEVAELLNAEIAQMDEKPECIILLGDNFYPEGVLSPNDEKFNTHFYNIYCNSKLKALHNIPIILILGNHCVNLRTGPGRQNGDGNAKRALAQLQHSLLRNPQPQMLFPPKDAKAGDPVSLDLKKLRAFNMPRAYFGFVTKGESKEEGCLLEFFANWNTIARDYLVWKKEEEKNPNNQIAFFKAQFKRYKAEYPNSLRTILYMHGPLSVHDRGLLHASNRFDLYLTAAEQKELREKFDGKYFNDVVRGIFEEIGVEIDVACSADTHALFNYLVPVNGKGKKPFYQVCAGGGGNSKLNKRQDGTNLKNLHYLKTHGFATLTIDLSDPKNRVQVDFYTVHMRELQKKKVHLQFDQFHEAPIVSEKSPAVMRLRYLIAKWHFESLDKLPKKDGVICENLDAVTAIDDWYLLFFQCKELALVDAVSYLREFRSKYFASAQTNPHHFLNDLIRLFEKTYKTPFMTFCNASLDTQAAVLGLDRSLPSSTKEIFAQLQKQRSDVMLPQDLPQKKAEGLVAFPCEGSESLYKAAIKEALTRHDTYFSADKMIARRSF